jgi:hypothetical protein
LSRWPTPEGHYFTGKNLPAPAKFDPLQHGVASLLFARRARPHRMAHEPPDGAEVKSMLLSSSASWTRLGSFPNQKFFPIHQRMCARAIALAVLVPGLDLVDMSLTMLFLDDIYSHLDRVLVLRAPFRAPPCASTSGVRALCSTLPRGTLGMPGSPFVHL